MKYTLPLIAFLSLAVSSLALDDATINQKIVGTWKMSTIPSIVTFQSDGTFVQTNTMNHSTYAGTWLVSSENLVTKPNGRPEESLKIVKISDRAFAGQHGTNTSHLVIGLKQVSDSGTTPTQIDQIQRDFGVVVKIRGDNIIVGTPGLKTKEEMSQIEDAIHKAFGNDFTNHTIVYIVK